MEGNGDLEGSDNEEEVNLFQRQKTIRDLPAEILRLIFGYMIHTQKLLCRLVCPDWNRQISTTLSKTSHFELTSKQSNETLLDSSVEWTKIKISDPQSTALPKEVKKLVTTLQFNISKSEVGSPDWMKFLNSFPELKKLYIQITDEEKKSYGHVDVERKNQFRNSRPDFRKIVQGLKELSVSFPFRHYKALNKFLEEVGACGEEMCLETLCIKENWPTEIAKTLSDNIDNHVGELLLRVHRIISTSSSNLTYLELDFNSNRIRIELMPDLVSKLSEVKELKLKSALIRHNPFKEHVERDFAILQEFLNIQMTTGVLKNIILPWSTNASLCQDIVKALPRYIKSVGNVRTEHITEDFPSKFKNLYSLSLGENITKEIIPRDQECDNIQQLHVDLKKYNFLLGGEDSFDECVTGRLSSITELKIVGNGGISFCDSDIEEITSTMKHLRVLHVENSTVSDRGVIGIDDDAENVLELVRTKKLYFYPNCVHPDDLVKNPLSSLENLEELVLTGTEITDVGIVLGFRFGSKLKHLTLESNSNEVSDLGLHCLGVNNPGLEAFYGYFKNGLISTTGIENLKVQLPFINSTQRFAVVNMESKTKS